MTAVSLLFIIIIVHCVNINNTQTIALENSEFENQIQTRGCQLFPRDSFKQWKMRKKCFGKFVKRSLELSLVRNGENLVGKSGGVDLVDKSGDENLLGESGGDNLVGETFGDTLVGKTNREDLVGQTIGDKVVIKNGGGSFVGKTVSDNLVGETVRDNLMGETIDDNLVGKSEVMSSADSDNSSLVWSFKQRWPIWLWRQWLFTDEYLLLINRHWLHFDPPEPASQYALGALYLAMMVVGCTGNTMVLVMYFRCRSLRTPGNILVANLALSDFLMLAKTPVFIFNSFYLGPALGKTGCIIYGFLGGLTGATSIATLSAIALDRYWAVVRPLQSVNAMTAIRARVLAFSTWVYACVFSIIPALDIGYGRYVPEGYLTSCSFDYLSDEPNPRYFIFVFFCAAWLVPFSTISFCYLSIFRVVTFDRNVNTQNQDHRLSSRHVKEQAKRKAEIKLAFLVIAVIALFFISWTPYAVVALLGIFGRKDLITPTSSMIPALFCKTTACINPFIYIITHPKFRKEFKKMLYRDKSRRMGTLKTIGYTENAVTRGHRVSKDLSDTDVEVVEMKDIPYQRDNKGAANLEGVKTISSRVMDRQDSQTSVSLKSFKESAVSPPSWYAKPQFSKKRSFHRRSSKSITSNNTEIL